MSDVAEFPVRGVSVGCGAFLVHLDSKICSAKSNRARHRNCEEGISDFIEKFFSHDRILPYCAARLSAAMQCGGNRPARDHATF
jgi:hypothetical protein